MSMNDWTTRAQRELVTKAYAEYARQRVDQGWTANLLTFMFKPLPGSPAAVWHQMESDIERVYATHVTRVVRKPTAPSSFGKLPPWFCFPDRPVFKHGKASLDDASINDGQHAHAIALDPPWSRLREGLDTHFERLQDLYVRREFPLLRVHAVPITHDLGYVVGYGRKAVEHGLFVEDATLILPKTRAEMLATP